MNYEQAKNMYENTRKRKLANNTYLLKHSEIGTNKNDCYAIALHGNQIIRFYPDKTVLSSCGWRTVTTKNRLNQFTEFNIRQKDFIWYVGIDDTASQLVLFVDGITYQNGKFS